VARTESIGADEVLPVVQTVGLAASLQLAGEVVLHGSAVAVGGRAILLLGSSGSGKSTTSVALLRAGHALLSDDIAAVTFDEGAPTVHPGPQRMRVAPATARAAGWEPERLPRVFSAAVLGDKLAVDPTGDAFCPIPLSIVAIYVLGPRGRHLQIAPLAPPDALRALLGNGYRSLLLSRAQHGRLLPHLARLAETVPTRRVGAEDDLASLPRLVEALVADAAAA
jgi:hypothetical protein